MEVLFLADSYSDKHLEYYDISLSEMVFLK